MSNVQESMKKALSDLRGELEKGTNPNSAITEIAECYKLNPDHLRTRAKALLADPTIEKFQDEEFRKSHSRAAKIKAAKDLSISAQINGGESDVYDAIYRSLGQDFSHEEKQEFCSDRLLEEISRNMSKRDKC